MFTTLFTMKMAITIKPRGSLLSGICLLGVVSILAGCGGSGGGERDGEDQDDFADTRAPTVSPVAQMNTPRNRVIALFSEAMDGTTINPTTFKLEDSGNLPVSGSVTYSELIATFTPDAQLAPGATYIVTITTGITDIAGNPLVSDVSWPITTVVSNSIQVSWDANPETAVNSTGGGYLVYYSSNSGFDPGDGGVTEIDVPYVSGASAPTSIVVPFDSGTYYLRIAAYSTVNPPGSAGGSISTASPQITLLVP